MITIRSLALSLMVCLLITAPAIAEEISLTEAEYPFAYATSPQQKNGAAYFTLRHMSPEPDRLTGASSPVAEKAEIHVIEKGFNEETQAETSAMKKMETLDIPTMSALYFEPSGRHIMLLGLTRQLVEGETFPLTLTFEKAGTITIDVLIVKSGDASAMKDDAHDHSHHEEKPHSH